MGNTILVNTFQGEAPSTLAASIRVSGIALIEDSTRIATNGINCQQSTKIIV